MDGRFARIELRVRAPLLHGQSLKICGAGNLLGNYDVTKAVPLVTSPEEYPVWRTVEPLVVPKGTQLFYNYVVFEGGTYRCWEAASEHRSFIASQDDNTVEDAITDGAAWDGDVAIPQHIQQAIEGATARSSTKKSLFAEDGLINSPQPDDARLFIICYHLPVQLFQDEHGEWCFTWAESLIAKTDRSVSEQITTFWVGTVKVPGKPELTEEEQETIREVLKPHNCIPLFVPEEVMKDHYLGYCKQIMWPVFHNVDQLDVQSATWRVERILNSNETSDAADMIAEEQRWWEGYNKMNETFSQMMQQLLRPGDIAWVHDYHLMLLPRYLSEWMNAEYGRRAVHLVFFMHIPFPTSQIFRSLTAAHELLEGMVSADVVGFHVFDHARHFLNACKRIMGLTYTTIPGGVIGVQYKDRHVMVAMSHVSIEPTVLNSVLPDERTAAAMQAWKNKHPGKRLICGVDTCQRLNGVAMKFAAFEKFLTDYPAYAKKVVLVQRSLRPSNRIYDEATTSSELRHMVAQINEKFGPVIDYEEPNGSLLPVHERVGLWLASDVFLLTVIREGLNLLPCEYVYARKDLEDAGVVIASEFSAVSTTLNGALTIDPFNARHVADMLDKALTMSIQEKAGRRQRDLPFISSRPSALWTKQVLLDMWALFGPRSDEPRLSELTLGDEACLDAKAVETSYLACKLQPCVASRVFILDYGGTLIEKENYGLYIKQTMSAISGRRPSDAMLAAIRALAANPSNAVLVITGLGRRKIEKIFGDIPNVTIASSNGLVHSWGANFRAADEIEPSPRTWETLDLDVDWREVVNIALPILTKFTARTNGSSISMREPGIGWSYFGTDPDWGDKQAAQLKIELEAALTDYDVRVQDISGMIELVPRSLHKGYFVDMFLERILAAREGKLPEFVLCLGDDQSDDDMFESIYRLLARAPKDEYSSDRIRAFTGMVDKKRTRAATYVNGVDHVLEILQPLAAASQPPVMSE